MRLSLAPLLLTTAQVAAFAPPSALLKSRKALGGHASGGLAMSSPAEPDGAPRVAPVKKVLTPADVMAKANAPQDPDAPGAQEKPKVFTPAIYDDFQSSLLLLEKRAKEGAGSLTLDEVERFEEEMGRIVKEMRDFMADPEGMAEQIRKSHEGGSAAVIETTSATVKDAAVEAVIEPSAPVPPPKPATPAEVPVTPVASSANANPPADSVLTGPDDAPAEDNVNFGLARGTTNTYAIPGMDEMSPEEYREKLQATVSAHQAHRRKVSLERKDGIIGNLSSNGYLDGLSRGQG